MSSEPTLSTILHDSRLLIKRKLLRLLWKARSTLAPTITIRTNIGRLTIFAHDNAIGWRLFFTRDYEPNLISAVSALLLSFPDWAPNQGTILDIGANIGMTSIRLVGSGLFRNAIAVEPEPQSFSVLVHNVAQNALDDKIVCINYALSDNPGAVTLKINPLDRGFTHVLPASERTVPNTVQSQIVSVQGLTLDQMLNNLPTSVADSINLIWIDVEGFETRVFTGGSRFLSKPVPTVAEFFPSAMSQVGISPCEYIETIRRIWSYFWVMRGSRFIRYPVALLDTLFEEFGHDPKHTHTNIVLT